MTDLLSSLDRRCFVETWASAVEEAEQDNPTVGLDVEEVAEEELVAGRKNEVMGAEGSNWPLPLPLPEWDELWNILGVPQESPQIKFQRKS